MFGLWSVKEWPGQSVQSEASQRSQVVSFCNFTYKSPYTMHAEQQSRIAQAVQGIMTHWRHHAASKMQGRPFQLQG